MTALFDYSFSSITHPRMEHKSETGRETKLKPHRGDISLTRRTNLSGSLGVDKLNAIKAQSPTDK